ncbi:PAS domain S-box protein [Cyanobacteria bacterium FACHB-472]|nr:PAS domain S-box protein [Cyanobacteria bacterium FACHB-472]
MGEVSTLSENLFVGGGEMGALMRSRDWSQTPLGAVETWTQSLRTIVPLVLNSRFPMVIWWGKELVLLYNDAWQPILGTKHPKALGRPGQEVWSEIWDIIGVQLNSVLETAQATWSDDMLLLVDRYGYTEETFFTYSYSPIFLETGEVGGAFTAVTETTRRVIGERRLRTLRELAASTPEAKSVEETCRIACATLANNPYDIPFALLYLVEQDEKARLVGTVRIDTGTPASPEQVDLTQATNCWKFAQVKKTGDAEIVDVMSRFGMLSGGAWDEPSKQAIVLPIAQAGQKHQLTGFLVIGISPRRAFDDEYRGFFDLVASNIASAIANTQAYEAERKRAEALAELDRAKTIFFSNVSQELRTPLTLMLAPLEDAIANLDGIIPAQEREQLLLVQRNGMRLLELVNSLLDFSRIEAGRVQAAYEPLDLATYTAELASTFRSLIERAGMSLIVDCPPLPEAIYVDREMWEKIVLNLERVTDAFMALDLDFRITYANVAAQRVWRTPLEALLGKMMWEAFPATIGNQFEIQYRRALSEQVAVEFEEYYAPFDLWVQVHAYPSQTGLSIFFRNINDRKKVEQERERFLALGSDLQVITGINGYFQWVSPTFERTLGWTSDEMTSRPWTEFVYPDDLSASVLETDSLFSGNETFTFENRYRHKDGSYRWLLWNAQPYLEEQLIYGAAVDITPRKQAQATLGESEARLRFMLDASQIGDWDLDLTTQPYTAHRSLRHDQIFGYESLLPEWNYDIFLTHIHPDDRASVNEGFQQTLWANTNWDFECRIIHADQSVHWISVRSSVYCGSSGTPTRLLGIVVDITDGKRAEQALRESEEQSRNIIESIGEAFFALDENWRFTYVNQFAETLLDRTPGDLIGKNFWEEYPGLIGSELEQMHRRVIRDRVARSLTAFYPDHDRWYEVRSYPAAQGITIYFRNVTDQIQAEAALRESEERYRTLFESIDEGFCIIEVLFEGNDTPIDYRFLEINPAFEQQTGLQQAVGKTARQLVPDIEDHWINIYGQVALTGKSVRFENGSEAMNRWYDVYACRTGQPEARKVAVVFKDISDRKRIEAEREQLLQREQTAREAAERANRIKDEFLAVLSHELRSPLNPILGWSNLLQRGNLDATKTATALATIERNARLQSQLIDDLLDISRILSGKLSLKAMSVDLNMVISAALETVRLAAEAKSLQIQTTFSPSQGMVIGDSGRLQQVIWNLLSNAVKFTPQGGQITVRLSQTGTHAQIQVTDTGKGINPEFLPYVFEHFRQEDGATTRKFGGLGLGLAIARQVVEMHGGTVTVDSPGIGLGATFTVQIPLAPRLIESPTLDPLPVRDSDLSGIHILVVDDETDSREFVAFVLEQAGAIVTSVASGINALQAFSQSVPNIIISDIGMPVMDGYMLMRQIRALPEGKEIPAIALTAYAGEVDRQQATAAGFQRHVAKPIDPEVVVAMVVELVSSL